MAGFSKIEWTDSTFNPWVGCTKIKRPGNKPSACDFCYAEKWAKRSGQVRWGNFARRRTTESYWRGPLGWNSQASDFHSKFGRRRRVFCASLADVFDNQVDAEWRADLFDLIRLCDQIDWQLLTKRPQNIKKMLPRDWGSGYPNVWLGTTAEDAISYQQRVNHLLALPAVVKFVSYEPALGPLGTIEVQGETPDWIIIGGESGVRADFARPTQPQWARDAIAECRRHSVAPFLKQWGSYSNNPLVIEDGLTIEEAMQVDPPANGKGGGKLDGEIWREFPSDPVVKKAKRKSKSSQHGIERGELLPG
jgi:protein gp37